MRFVLPLILSAVPALSQDLPQYLPLPIVCTSLNPDWALEITADTSPFFYLYGSDLDLALETVAEGRDWPRALTLIGRGDSAIVMLQPQTCESGDMSAMVLTQRGETPVLLTGCCQSTQP